MEGGGAVNSNATLKYCNIVKTSMYGKPVPFNKTQKQTLLSKNIILIILKGCRGFPGGAVVENLPANAGDKDSSPGLGRSHMPRSN